MKNYFHKSTVVPSEIYDTFFENVGSIFINHTTKASGGPEERGPIDVDDGHLEGAVPGPGVLDALLEGDVVREVPDALGRRREGDTGTYNRGLSVPSNQEGFCEAHPWNAWLEPPVLEPQHWEKLTHKFWERKHFGVFVRSEGHSDY